jgi:hypothetical protein
MMKRLVRVALLAFCAVIFLQPTFGQVSVSVSFGPPALPVYDLPVCPGDGYLWTPGYWAWDPDYGYYWVPGTWIMAPEPGFLWTPGYWGWGDGGFLFHEGYWGPHVGFYGGINYGFGYFGVGFGGGMWAGNVFRYNTAVLNVDTTIVHNTYIDRTVVINTTVNHVSYNGGEGGIQAHPNADEQRYAQEQHRPPSSEQQQHAQAARGNPAMRASQNHGAPEIAATSKPGEFSGGGVVKAREAGAPYKEPANAPGAHASAGATEHAKGEAATEHANPTDAKDLQSHTVTQPNTGNPKLDKQYLQQQQKLVDKQNLEHQKLQQQQDKEHQTAAQKNYTPQQTQKLEQKHAQQTQKLEQQHTQETQKLQARQTPKRPQ